MPNIWASLNVPFIHFLLQFFPNSKTLNSLAYHIIGVTTLAVLFAILGAGIRLGGFA
jgi:hypothetical protein